ncbi:uncharacterized protein MONOS_5405 [Monocercomonoides exilis]|uniref:uncharacterized protein n=1 Tax=Monocercomonoides exilis TaxID=2049356 RepID=UPI00355A5B34|nr:hypothetical protein MONOS_5405 [Monocercomonoides exilis]|eukprot:MONOS_5405.1-p1 / transcript=MONOS_5405.1 / gene=MONOS_5405 / organism=Monocercomonoides_exilis_PA203 / gene_product=unspecified product / transcript_product=unspecified product / location=Mono_scaffold00156:68124-71060(-) / protein_length=714 / sequence_SO=supercontig / SO=protein_coding / is_pseudo=false
MRCFRSLQVLKDDLKNQDDRRIEILKELIRLYSINIRNAEEILKADILPLLVDILKQDKNRYTQELCQSLICVLASHAINTESDNNFQSTEIADALLQISASSDQVISSTGINSLEAYLRDKPEAAVLISNSPIIMSMNEVFIQYLHAHESTSSSSFASISSSLAESSFKQNADSPESSHPQSSTKFYSFSCPLSAPGLSFSKTNTQNSLSGARGESQQHGKKSESSLALFSKAKFYSSPSAQSPSASFTSSAGTPSFFIHSTAPSSSSAQSEDPKEAVSFTASAATVPSTKAVASLLSLLSCLLKLGVPLEIGVGLFSLVRRMKKVDELVIAEKAASCFLVMKRYLIAMKEKEEEENEEEKSKIEMPIINTAQIVKAKKEGLHAKADEALLSHLASEIEALKEELLLKDQKIISLKEQISTTKKKDDSLALELPPPFSVTNEDGDGKRNEKREFSRIRREQGENAIIGKSAHRGFSDKHEDESSESEDDEDLIIFSSAHQRENLRSSPSSSSGRQRQMAHPGLFEQTMLLTNFIFSDETKYFVEGPVITQKLPGNENFAVPVPLIEGIWQIVIKFLNIHEASHFIFGIVPTSLGCPPAGKAVGAAKYGVGLCADCGCLRYNGANRERLASPFRTGDELILEINHNPDKHTMHIFKNGVQENLYYSGIPASVIIAGRMYFPLDSCCIHTLRRLSRPTVNPLLSLHRIEYTVSG